MRVRFIPWVSFFAAALAFGESPAEVAGCRAPWMSLDAPAFCPWETEPMLPEPRAYHAVVAANDQVYVLGGFRFDASSGQVIYYDSVLRSTVGANGRLGAWSTEKPFQTARSGAAAARVGNCLFLAGGSSSTPTSLSYYDDVQSARLANTGHVWAWTTSPNRLRVARSNSSLVAISTPQGTFLHMVAGVTQIGADTVHLDTIEVAKVEDDCRVGPWALANFHLKGGRSTPQALAVRNQVVVIGGWGDLDLIDVFDDVQISLPRPDGTPAPWRTSPGRLTTGLYGHATVFVEPVPPATTAELLTVGGQPGTGAYATWIGYSYVSAGLPVADSVGIWRIAPTGRLPSGRAGLGAFVARSRLFVIGGNDANGQYLQEVLSARFDPGRP